MSFFTALGDYLGGTAQAKQNRQTEEDRRATLAQQGQYQQQQSQYQQGELANQTASLEAQRKRDAADDAFRYAQLAQTGAYQRAQLSPLDVDPQGKALPLLPTPDYLKPKSDGTPATYEDYLRAANDAYAAGRPIQAAFYQKQATTATAGVYRDLQGQEITQGKIPLDQASAAAKRAQAANYGATLTEKKREFDQGLAQKDRATQARLEAAVAGIQQRAAAVTENAQARMAIGYQAGQFMLAGQDATRAENAAIANYRGNEQAYVSAYTNSVRYGGPPPGAPPAPVAPVQAVAPAPNVTVNVRFPDGSIRPMQAPNPNAGGGGGGSAGNQPGSSGISDADFKSALDYDLGEIKRDPSKRANIEASIDAVPLSPQQRQQALAAIAQSTNQPLKPLPIQPKPLPVPQRGPAAGGAAGANSQKIDIGAISNQIRAAGGTADPMTLTYEVARAHAAGISDPSYIRSRLLEEYAPKPTTSAPRDTKADTAHTATAIFGVPPAVAQRGVNAAPAAPVAPRSASPTPTPPEQWARQYVESLAGLPRSHDPQLVPQMAAELRRRYPHLSPPQALTIAANAQRAAAGR